MIQDGFVNLLRSRMKVCGQIHLATDWQHYAVQMMEVMESNAGFKNIAGQQQYAPRPERRPLTKFEKRGTRLGHGVWDLIFEKLE